MPTALADLRWDAAPTAPAAVVLVLHGGQEHSTATNGWLRLPVLRMLPIARSIRSAGDDRLAVARLRYAVRGWNDDAENPLRDTEAALDTIAARYPGVPIALVGHSMGGRVALRLMGDRRVAAVVGLAPWLERSDTYRAHAGLRLLVLHGTLDRITSPRASRLLVERFSNESRVATWVGLAREKHAMLHRRRTWDALTAAWLRATLLDAPPTRPLPMDQVVALEPGSVSVV